MSEYAQGSDDVQAVLNSQMDAVKEAWQQQRRRDYAMAALQGMLGCGSYSGIAQVAFNIADAMLESEKK